MRASVRRIRHSAGARLTTITVDQVVSGASNVLIALLAARLLDAAQFGLFGIVLLVYVILVSVTRALVSDILLMHPLESEQRPGEAIGTACVLSLALAAGLAAIGAALRVWNAGFADALLVLAACLPLLVAQDVGRYLGFATQRPLRAVVLDAVWLVAMLGGVAVLFATGTHKLDWLIAAWAGSGAAAGLLLFARYPLRSVRLDLHWLRETWGVAWRFLVGYLSTQSGALGMSSEIGGIAGARALGGVQGALLLTRPFTTFQVAVVAHGIGEVARSLGRVRRIWRHALVTSGLAGAVALLNAIVMAVLPAGVGRLLLGASWAPAKPLLVAVGAQILCIALATGPQAALVGMRAMGKSMALGMLAAVALFSTAGAGALIDGARGALWLAAAGQAVVLTAAWMAFVAHMRRLEPVVEAVPRAPASAPLVGVGALPASSPAFARQPWAPALGDGVPPAAATDAWRAPSTLRELAERQAVYLREGVRAWRDYQLARRVVRRRLERYLESLEPVDAALTPEREPAGAALPLEPADAEAARARWLPR
jgi:O-antigen/teichoic acid export membrane protein